MFDITTIVELSELTKLFIYLLPFLFPLGSWWNPRGHGTGTAAQPDPNYGGTTGGVPITPPAPQAPEPANPNEINLVRKPFDQLLIEGNVFL